MALPTNGEGGHSIDGRTLAFLRQGLAIAGDLPEFNAVIACSRFCAEFLQAIPATTSAYLPRLVPCDSFNSHELSKKLEQNLLDDHPKEILNFVSALMGPDATRWSYGINNVSERLIANELTCGDPQLTDLKANSICWADSSSHGLQLIFSDRFPCFANSQ